MKNIALLSAVAFLVLPSLAADSKADSHHAPSHCTPEMTDNGVRCGDMMWLNIETVTVEAANGDPLAQYTLAYLTETGQGVQQDTAKAHEMYAHAAAGLKKAAESGNKHACKALAHMYAHGKGVPQCDEQSAAYMKMCDQCTQ